MIAAHSPFDMPRQYPRENFSCIDVGEVRSEQDKTASEKQEIWTEKNSSEHIQGTLVLGRSHRGRNDVDARERSGSHTEEIDLDKQEVYSERLDRQEEDWNDALSENVYAQTVN
jgi:hypothetical protein